MKKEIIVWFVSLMMLFSISFAESSTINDAFFNQEFIRVETKYFSFLIPPTWFQSQQSNGAYSFKATSSSDTIGGFASITEMDLSSAGTIPEDMYSTIYSSVAEGLKNASGISGFASQLSDFNGTPIMLCSYNSFINGNSLFTFSVLYISDGHLLTFSYIDEAEANKTVMERAVFLFCTVNSKHTATSSTNSVTFDGITVSIDGASTYTSGNHQYLIVEHTWQHSYAEPTAFAYSISTEAYQDGIECDIGYLLDYSGTLSTKTQANTSYTCYSVFQLRNTTSPVTVIIDKCFDFTDQYDNLEYTISLQ